MNEVRVRSDHLIKNLDRVSLKNSIFNYNSGRKAFLSLGQGNLHEWLDAILPDTRLILEPKIIGSAIAIQYIDGKLNKAINENCEDITERVKSIKNIPIRLPVKNRIEIRGVLYEEKNTTNQNSRTEFIGTQNTEMNIKRLRFCAFQIYHCNINHFQSLQELKQLLFEIPETQFTKFISDIEIYLECWKEGRIFKRYPTNGIVLKINSRKLQKYLGENNVSIHWAYAIN